MRKELTDLKRDVEKICEAKKMLEGISTVNMDAELKKLIEYAISRGIIKSLVDVIELCNELPDYKKLIADTYQKIHDDKIRSKSHSSCYSKKDYCYSGTYSSLREAPGYGTEWNERCIPDGIIVGGNNSRC